MDEPPRPLGRRLLVYIVDNAFLTPSRCSMSIAYSEKGKSVETEFVQNLISLLRKYKIPPYQKSLTSERERFATGLVGGWVDGWVELFRTPSYLLNRFFRPAITILAMRISITWLAYCR